MSDAREGEGGDAAGGLTDAEVEELLAVFKTEGESRIEIASNF